MPGSSTPTTRTGRCRERLSSCPSQSSFAEWSPGFCRPRIPAMFEDRHIDRMRIPLSRGVIALQWQSRQALLDQFRHSFVTASRSGSGLASRLSETSRSIRSVPAFHENQDRTSRSGAATAARTPATTRSSSPPSPLGSGRPSARQLAASPRMLPRSAARAPASRDRSPTARACAASRTAHASPRWRRRGRARAPPRPIPHRHRPTAQHGSARRRSGARSPPNTAGASAPAAQVSVVFLLLAAGRARRRCGRPSRTAPSTRLPDIDALHPPAPPPRPPLGRRSE